MQKPKEKITFDIPDLEENLLFAKNFDTGSELGLNPIPDIPEMEELDENIPGVRKHSLAQNFEIGTTFSSRKYSEAVDLLVMNQSSSNNSNSNSKISKATKSSNWKSNFGYGPKTSTTEKLFSADATPQNFANKNPKNGPKTVSNISRYTKIFKNVNGNSLNTPDSIKVQKSLQTYDIPNTSQKVLKNSFRLSKDSQESPDGSKDTSKIFKNNNNLLLKNKSEESQISKKFDKNFKQKYVNESSEGKSGLKTISSEGKFLSNLLSIYFLLGRSQDCEELIFLLLRSQSMQNNHLMLANLAKTLSMLLIKEEDIENATKLLELVLGFYKASMCRLGIASTLLALGYLKRKSKEYGSARSKLNESLKHYRILDHIPGQYYCLSELKIIFKKLNKGDANFSLQPDLKKVLKIWKQKKSDVIKYKGGKFVQRTNMEILSLVMENGVINDMVLDRNQQNYVHKHVGKFVKFVGVLRKKRKYKQKAKALKEADLDF